MALGSAPNCGPDFRTQAKLKLSEIFSAFSPPSGSQDLSAAFKLTANHLLTGHFEKVKAREPNDILTLISLEF